MIIEPRMILNRREVLRDRSASHRCQSELVTGIGHAPMLIEYARCRDAAGYCALPGVASLMTAMLEPACKRRSVLARLSCICTRRRAKEDHEGVQEMPPAAAYV